MAKHGDGTRRNVTNQVLLENILTWKLSGSQHGLKNVTTHQRQRACKKTNRSKNIRNDTMIVLSLGIIWQNWETEQACHMDTYHGGLQCCKHSWFLTDVDQDHLIPKDKVNTQNCPWNILSVKKLWHRWTHTIWSGATTSKSTLLPQRRNLPPINIFTTGSSS